MHVAGPSLQARRAGVLTTNTNRDDEVSGHIIGPFIGGGLAAAAEEVESQFQCSFSSFHFGNLFITKSDIMHPST